MRVPSSRTRIPPRGPGTVDIVTKCMQSPGPAGNMGGRLRSRSSKCMHKGADMKPQDEQPFALQGLSHLALVCSDMARTVDFYTTVLGLRLIKTLELPAGIGQHFFFDIGNGDSLAFFWFADAPGPAPGIAAPVARPDNGESTSAVGSMNHVAFQVAPEQIESYRQRLVEHGVDCSVVVNHDDSEWTVAEE